MERTISGMMGKGSVNHNTRAFSAKNVDKERSRDNVEFCHKDIKAVYHELFDEALERYNAKQKRSDRKIENYYEKIRQGKQEKLFYEVIFQIGNRDDMNARSEEGQLAKQILIDFMTDFQSRNPNLHVFSAHLHMDEETPHIHIDFIPVITGSKPRFTFWRMKLLPEPISSRCGQKLWRFTEAAGSSWLSAPPCSGISKNTSGILCRRTPKPE